MKILHISSIINSQSKGVSVVVPQHIIAQQKLVTVGLWNVNGIRIDNIENMFVQKDFSKLPSEFSDPDLVVFHEVYKKEYIQISKFLRAKKIPYIIIPHGSLVKKSQNRKKLKKLAGNLLFFNKFIYGAAALQCLTENEKNTTEFETEKFICPNGISLKENCKKSFHENEFKIVYIGRMDITVKGLDMLADAAEILKDFLAENNAKIEVYGPDSHGTLDGYKATVSQKKIDCVFTVNPAVFGEDKEKILLDADAFIQTSRHEGMPMGILEAMSYGLPCIATKGTSMTDILNEYNCGWCAENSAESIAQTIKKAVEEKQLLSLKSTNAKNWADSNLDWRIVAKNTVEKYKLYI